MSCKLVTPSERASAKLPPALPRQLLFRKRRDNLFDEDDRVARGGDAGRRLAVLLADDDPADGIGRRGRDAGKAEGLAVGEGHVAVVAADEDGAVGDVAIHQRRGGELAGEGPVVVPAAAEDPPPARQLGVELPQPPAEFRFVGGVLQRHPAQSCSAAEQVDVAVVEPRHYASAVQVDHASARPDQRPHLGVAAEEQDAVAPDCDR